MPILTMTLQTAPRLEIPSFVDFLNALWSPFPSAFTLFLVIALAVALGASFALLAALHPRLAARRSLRVTITGVLVRGAASGPAPRSPSVPSLPRRSLPSRRATTSPC